jgi:hypothetical protein
MLWKGTPAYGHFNLDKIIFLLKGICPDEVYSAKTLCSSLDIVAAMISFTLTSIKMDNAMVNHRFVIHRSNRFQITVVME